MRIYTLGTADRQHYEFTKVLNKYGIQVVFDIRRSPTSPQAPQFNRDSLLRLCASQNADYVYLGNSLGGPASGELRPHDSDYRGHSDAATRDWLASDEFKRCVAIIAGKADKRVTCVLCTERLPDCCHRMFVAGALAGRGFEVAHILDETWLWTPPSPGSERPRHQRPRTAEHRSNSGGRNHR
jgi:uncharacterized protein (DUF488 family)